MVALGCFSLPTDVNSEKTFQDNSQENLVRQSEDSFFPSQRPF